MSKLLLLFVFCIYSLNISAQQQEADNDYHPSFEDPLFELGKGPLMLIDQAHNNFHTLEGNYAPFGKIATMNGFNVKSNHQRITENSLKEVKILVIVNALNSFNIDNWSNPVLSAFDSLEINVIHDWVYNGGRLFLIADHMPFSGAVSELAKIFGFTFYNGFAYCKPNQKLDIFTLENQMLQKCELTKGVDSIVLFTGQAFQIPKDAVSIITLDSTFKLLMPETAWQFNKNMEMISAEGFSQLAYCTYGSGKIIVSGEAAMFTAQKVGNFKFGLNAPFASNNLKLLLHILKWLSE